MLFQTVNPSLTEMLAGIIGVLTFAGFVAWVVESTVENLVLPFIEAAGLQRFNKLIAFVVGVVASLVVGIDFITPFAGFVGVDFLWPFAGLLFSAVIVGRGSNFVHNVFTRIEGTLGGGFARHTKSPNSFPPLILPVTLAINGVRHSVTANYLTYGEVLMFADGKHGSTVTYRNGPASSPEGVLMPGERVKVDDGMIFTVSHATEV